MLKISLLFIHILVNAFHALHTKTRTKWLCDKQYKMVDRLVKIQNVKFMRKFINPPTPTQERKSAECGISILNFH